MVNRQPDDELSIIERIARRKFDDDDVSIILKAVTDAKNKSGSVLTDTGGLTINVAWIPERLEVTIRETRENTPARLLEWVIERIVRQ